MGVSEMVAVRRTRADEADALGDVMWSAIHNAPSLYTSEQRRAWLAAPPRGAEWAAKLAAQEVWVACDGDARIGFITLADGGYIDLVYVCADAQGCGVFSALCAALEAVARQRSLPRLWAYASLMAQPAFTARGFHVIAHETVARRGQVLNRAQMEKVLR